VNRRGEEAERLAAQFLQREGLRIVERNWRCRMGENDLVAKDDASIVFVEVRLRASQAFGGAAASIDWAKRRKLIAAANLYIGARRIDAPCRFDAVLLDLHGGIEWLRDAFRAD
jgi:putative endonuclease